MKTVFINCSPKKKFSASAHFLGICRLAVYGDVVKTNVRSKGDYKKVLEHLKGADNTVFVLPLYVDGVPSHILGFMKELENFCRENNITLNIYVISNGGFIEGEQNQVLMKIFENFCARSGLTWCGGVGIGGGVMLNVMRMLFLVFTGILLLSVAISGIEHGEWLPQQSFIIYAKQLALILFLHAGVIAYVWKMGLAISKSNKFGIRYTRVMMPSFLFIIVADFFFTAISLFKGGMFRGWLSEK